jgi:hypothetical protein
MFKKILVLTLAFFIITISFSNAFALNVFEVEIEDNDHYDNPLVTDVEYEVAVYLLAEKLGVPCCPAYRTDKDTVFSAFLYDFSKE